MKLSLPMLALLGLAACGGSNDGTVSGLNVPQQVTLVEAQGNQGSLKLPSYLKAADYDTDPAQFWVHDESMEPLDTVNMILCMLSQTGYDDPDVLNAGPYLCLVGCDDRGDAPKSGGREGQAMDLEEWVVESTRASAADPHVVKFWVKTEGNVPGTNNSPPAIIYGRLTITQSPTDTLPYGRFTLQFKQLLATALHNSTATLFQGTLATVPRQDGQAEFVFFNSFGDVTSTPPPNTGSYRSRTRLVGSADGGSGRAYSESWSKYHNGTSVQSTRNEYFLQFNANYLARKRVGTSNTTQVLDRNNFSTTVFRYGVYDAQSGARIKRLSGFGVDTAGGRHGWAGYHGLWFPDDVTITNGQTLYRRSFNSSTPVTYSAVVADGRLEKMTRSSSTLGNIKNETLESHSGPNRLQIRWNGTVFEKTATWNDNSRSWTPHTPPITHNYSAGNWVNLWSQARGQIEFRYPSTAPNDATVVKITKNSPVLGNAPELSGGSLTLYGYFQQLRAGITQNQANYANNETPYFPDATAVNSGNQTYAFDATTMLLKLASTPVTLANGVTVTSGPGFNGFWTGPLYTTPLTNLNDAATRTTAYTWSTGTNAWNKLRTIKDAQNNWVNFDPPLALSYTHNEPSNTAFHGKAFGLEWEGSDLHGIPYVEDSSGRWYPAFNIPSGTVVTDGNRSYKIKQLEGEQKMNVMPNPSAIITQEGFDLNTTLTPPNDAYSDPNIGAVPSVTTPPRFVNGVKQS